MAKRYSVSKFDSDTYQVVDNQPDAKGKTGEVCVVSNYPEKPRGAKGRAENIARLLNEQDDAEQMK